MNRGITIIAMIQRDIFIINLFFKIFVVQNKPNVYKLTKATSQTKSLQSLIFLTSALCQKLSISFALIRTISSNIWAKRMKYEDNNFKIQKLYLHHHNSHIIYTPMCWWRIHSCRRRVYIKERTRSTHGPLHLHQRYVLEK